MNTGMIQSFFISLKSWDADLSRNRIRVQFTFCRSSAHSGFSAVNSQKNPRSSLQDRGLIGCINPHRILSPKTVREHPNRSSGSPLPARLPNRLRSVARFGRDIGPAFTRDRDYSGGSAPDSHGIPLAWMWSLLLLSLYSIA